MAMLPALDRYSNARAVKDLHIVMGGKIDTVFLEFVHDHLDDFVAVLQCLCCRRALGDGAKSTQSRAVGMKSALIGLHDDFESIGLHGTWLQCKG